MERAIRTLFVLPSGADCPAAQLAWHLVSHLPRRAIEPSVCFLEDGPVALRWRGALRIRAQALGPAGKAPGLARAARELAAMIRTQGVQLVHAVGGVAQLAAGGAARIAGVPAVWTQPGVARWGRWRDVRAARSHARAIIVHSPAAERAQRRMLLFRRGCHHVAPGVSLPERLPEHRRRDARRLLGLPDDALLVASIGPLDDAAAHERFLLAGASLCHARPLARLLIAGTRGERRDTADGPVARRAEALGLRDRTGFADPAHLARAFDACDIVFHGALGEPEVPVALLEAMAAGVAVVVEESPLVAETIVRDTTALVAPPDHEALAARLLALADSPGHRAALATAGARIARERHDADAMAGRLIEIYGGLVAT